jgi:biotin operon repressor
MNSMKQNTLLVFEEIFHNSDLYNTFITNDELSTMTGLSVHELRSSIEDLKEAGYIIEDENGLQITACGKTEGGTRWID